MHLYTVEYAPSIQIGAMDRLNIVLYMLGGELGDGKMINKIERIKELTSLLNKAADAYYNTGTTIMEDRKYDSLLEELRSLEQETGFVMMASPTHKVGYEVKSELRKVTHNHPMLSLAKTKNWNEFIEYFGSKDVIGMEKMDGLTCSLRYINGELVSAETRGNGEVGEDILHNIKTVKTVPQKIPYKDELIIDGEIICTYQDFEPFSTEYKNPRNFASGSIRLLDSNECAKRPLTFVVWNIVKGFDDENSFLRKLVLADGLGFTVVPWTSSFDWDAKEFLVNKAKKLGYPIDGLVGRFGDIKYGESLGATSHHSNAAYAFKFGDETYETVLRDVEWNTTRTGIIAPVAVFDEVDLDGALTTRATLHNLSIIEQLELGIGDTITVYRSNMVIPKVYDNLIRSNTLTIPNTCPCCGEPTEIKYTDNSKVLMCTNLNCAAKKLAQFTHFVSRKAMSIDGLSEKTLELLISHGFLHNYKDIYRLKEHKNEITQLPGMGVKSVDKLLDSIEKSRTVTLDRFITALGIPNIGSSAAKAISKQFNGDHYDFVQALANGYDFSQIDDFGEITNKSIHDWWNSKDPMVELLPVEMNFVVENDVSSSSSLNGKSFCITGSLTHYANRDVLVKAIEDNGGKYVSGVSKKTDYLINNDTTSTSGKNKKAIELNIPIISEDDFLKMLSE
jgi:DNA ligase (NAD+)|nr:MAG TPA: DNA ligase [Caudoviricetes sp.]